MQVNLTFRAPEIEGATPTIMVEMVLGGKAPSPIIRQVLEAAVGQCCTVTLSTLGIDVNVVYRAAIRTEFYDPWTIGLSLLVQRLRNEGLTLQQIGEQANTTPNNVSKILRALKAQQSAETKPA